MKRKSSSNKNDSEGWNVRLRQILKEKGISQRKAASIARVSASVVDSWVSGSSPTDYMAVKRLADGLGVSFTWLLTGDHEQESHEPTVSELFQEVEFFDGYARVRIDRLMPRKKSETKD